MQRSDNHSRPSLIPSFAIPKQQAVNFAEMAAEYWQEESPLIAKKRHVEDFVKKVDVLRDDVERLEKRLAKLLTK